MHHERSSVSGNLGTLNWVSGPGGQVGPGGGCGGGCVAWVLVGAAPQPSEQLQGRMEADGQACLAAHLGWTPQDKRPATLADHLQLSQLPMHACLPACLPAGRAGAAAGPALQLGSRRLVVRRTTLGGKCNLTLKQNMI